MDNHRVINKGMLIIAVFCLPSLFPIKILLEQAGIDPKAVRFYLGLIAAVFGFIFVFALIPLILSRAEQDIAQDGGKELLKAGEIYGLSDWDTIEFATQLKFQFFPWFYSFLIRDGSGKAHFEARNHFWGNCSIKDLQTGHTLLWIRQTSLLGLAWNIFDFNGQILGKIIRPFNFEDQLYKVQNVKGEEIGEIKCGDWNQWGKMIWNNCVRIFFKGNLAGECLRTSFYPATYAFHLREDPQRHFDRTLALAMVTVFLLRRANNTRKGRSLRN